MQGFKLTELFPLTDNGFQDHEFAPTNVTDRPLSSSNNDFVHQSTLDAFNDRISMSSSLL